MRVTRTNRRASAPRSAAPAGVALAATLRSLLILAGAEAGALALRVRRAPPLVVTASAGPRAAGLEPWLRDAVEAPVTRPTLVRATAPGRRASTRLLRVPLGTPARPVGMLALVGPHLTERAFAAAVLRDLGVAIDRIRHLRERQLRMSVLNEITLIGVSARSLADVVQAFVQGLGRLTPFDSMTVSIVDAERGEFEVLGGGGGSGRLGAQGERVPVGSTLLEEVIARGEPLRVDDLSSRRVPPRSRARLAGLGFRSALVVPLVSAGGVFGAVTLASRRRAAFDAEDAEVVAELARPLASALEQRRLLDESRRRAEELQALWSTSRLVTARRDVASVLDAISRAVLELTGSTGCGIALLDESGQLLANVAAHGFTSEEWRALTLPLGEGIIGGCAATGAPTRVDDVRSDARSARRDVDEREGIRSMLCVPLFVEGRVRGVISAISTRTAAFTAHHERVLEAFADQAGLAIHDAQLYETSVRGARETRALLAAGRAVTASLDVGETIRVILDQARAVLGADSCSLMTVDDASGDLITQASLDLPAEMAGRIRLRPGEGIAGLAIAERRAIQSPDLLNDARVRYRDLPRTSGFRSMLAVPLRVGDRAVGVLTVFRRDVHAFSASEEELLLALADQAAIALEHARLYTALEAVVAERTRELEGEKRFVEVVLEALPLGVFVIDGDLRVVRANREGARALGCGGDVGCRFPDLVTPGRAPAIAAFLQDAFVAGQVASMEEEMTLDGEARIFRLIAAAFEPAGAVAPHAVVLVEDITRAKRLEQQMLLTERLTTAGRLAAGVAHELNNPLATIAGCAEALLARLDEGELAQSPALPDFRQYLGLIEEESYRCKEITGSLLQFVREPGSRRGPTDVNDVVAKTVELLSHQARFAKARLVTELDPEAPRVTANEGQLRQVFLGLASNALEAMDGQGGLTIRTRSRGGELEIEFEDEGPGIAEDVLPRIFDPFFTTKPPGQGTGLGLAIAQGIVADHGGRIEVTSRLGKGSTFRVVLPV